jgi:hypothetical protein
MFVLQKMSWDLARAERLHSLLKNLSSVSGSSGVQIGRSVSTGSGDVMATQIVMMKVMSRAVFKVFCLNMVNVQATGLCVKMVNAV